MKKSLSCIGIILFFLVIFIAVYAPVIQMGYFHLDDYVYFEPPQRTLEQFMDEAFHEGRLLEGPFLYILSTIIKSSESTTTVRLIGIIGLALFASVVYFIFKRCRFRSDQAFLISALICTLPFIQLFVSWMIVVPSVYSALLSSLSALILFNVVFQHNNKTTNTVIGFLTAIILLVAALSINQPPAMMYWAMGVIFFLTGDNSDFSKKECRQQVIGYFFIGLISIVIYYLIFIKLIPFMMSASIYRDNVIPIGGMPNRLMWFLTGPLLRTMNLWNPDPTFIFAAFTGVIIFTGIILSLLQEIKEKKQFSAINWLIKYFLISSMVALCFLPKLMVREPSLIPTYWLRTLISLGPAVSILFLFGVINIVEFFKFIPNFSTKLRKAVVTLVLAILTVVTAFSAHNNVKYFATLYSTELNHIKNSIIDYGVSNLLKTSKIYIRRSTTRRFPPEDRFNEFKGTLTTAPKGGIILYVIKRALHDVGVKADIQNHHGNLHGDLQVTHVGPDDPVPEGKNILIIDMMIIEKLDKYI